VAFLLVAFGSGIATAGISYVTARDALLQGSQDQVMNEFVARVSELSRELPALDESAMRPLASRVGGSVAVYFRDDRGAESIHLPEDMVVPSQLVAAVSQGDRVYFQRVTQDEQPYLFVGTAIREDGQPSGVEVYQRFFQGTSQQSLDEVLNGSIMALGVAGIAALILALVAARSVLRPVRALNRGAQQLGQGALDTRLPVRGTDELSELVSNFNTAAAQLEATVDQLRREEANSRRFVADVSHELRTPLAAMVAMTETLDAEAHRFGDDGARAASVLTTETHRLAELVENLIEISRFDAGQASLVLEDIDLVELVSACIGVRGWTGDVELHVRPAAGETAVRVTADPRRLDVIVANLVGNALSHGESPVTVEVYGDAVCGKVGIRVHDAGTGLAPEVAAHVFERFYKADRARTRSAGSGLGLAIAMENARLHGGRIDLYSKPGAGTTFTLHLPDRSGRGREEANS
jgi:two-component system sensor histidine kinase MtrB